MGSLCSRQGAEKEHSRHEKRNKSRKKKVSPANQKQISSLTSDIDLELKDLDKDFAQLEEANKKHKNNEHQNKRNQDRRRSTLATIENFDMGGGGFEITLENPSLEHLEDEEKKKKKKVSLSTSKIISIIIGPNFIPKPNPNLILNLGR